MEYSLDRRKTDPSEQLFLLFNANSYLLISDNIMSSEVTKTAKEPFVPKYEIAAGLHKGRKIEKFVTKRVRPTRRTQV